MPDVSHMITEMMSICPPPLRECVVDACWRWCMKGAAARGECPATAEGAPHLAPALQHCLSS